LIQNQAADVGNAREQHGEMTHWSMKPVPPHPGCCWGEGFPAGSIKVSTVRSRQFISRLQELRTALGDNQHLNEMFSCFAMYFQLEPIRKQRLNHQAEFTPTLLI
jgi:hypothetical protein